MALCFMAARQPNRPAAERRNHITDCPLSRLKSHNGGFLILVDTVDGSFTGNEASSDYDDAFEGANDHLHWRK